MVTSKHKIGQEISLNNLYDGPISIQKAKLDDVKKLLELLHHYKNKTFYVELINKQSGNMDDPPLDNDDNSSGCED